MLGLASMTVLIYLAECCPAHLRGTMVKRVFSHIDLFLCVRIYAGNRISTDDHIWSGNFEHSRWSLQLFGSDSHRLEVCCAASTLFYDVLLG